MSTSVIGWIVLGLIAGMIANSLLGDRAMPSSPSWSASPASTRSPTAAAGATGVRVDDGLIDE